MKIEISCQETGTTTQRIFRISNEHINSDKWISIQVGSGMVDVLIEDLMPALIAFDAKNSRASDL